MPKDDLSRRVAAVVDLLVAEDEVLLDVYHVLHVRVDGGAARITTTSVAWVVGTYRGFCAAAMLAHCISYLFYFLPPLPAAMVVLAQLVQ